MSDHSPMIRVYAMHFWSCDICNTDSPSYETPDDASIASVEHLRHEHGYSYCKRCRKLRPPHGTKDYFGREAGFYHNNFRTDDTCAPCRRELAPTYPSAQLR